MTLLPIPAWVLLLREADSSYSAVALAALKTSIVTSRRTTSAERAMTMTSRRAAMARASLGAPPMPVGGFFSDLLRDSFVPPCELAGRRVRIRIPRWLLKSKYESVASSASAMAHASPS